MQLPWAGVERFVHLVDDERVWTCAKGVYAEPVAELALTLGLAGLRGLGTYGRASSVEPSAGDQPPGRPGHHPRRRRHHESLLRLLQPFDCHVTVVRNRAQPMEGADVVLESDRLTDGWPGPTSWCWRSP